MGTIVRAACIVLSVFLFGCFVTAAEIVTDSMAELEPTQDVRMAVVYEYSCAEHRATGGVCGERWEK